MFNASELTIDKSMPFRVCLDVRGGRYFPFLFVFGFLDCGHWVFRDVWSLNVIVSVIACDCSCYGLRLGMDRVSGR